MKRRSAASPSSIQWTKPRIDLAEQSQRAVDHPVIETARCYQRRNRHGFEAQTSSLLLIAGPTASGKSALALLAAERTGGVIVNADSAQVYRDLPVLSAAPTQAELRLAEHRLYGYLDGVVASSAAEWAARAAREIADVHSSGRTPILVGGTGLYFRTLLDGIAPVPSIDPAVRKRVREASVDDNRARLAKLDPDAAARLKPGDTTRIARALEVVHPPAERSRIGKHIVRGHRDAIELRPLVLLPPRDRLYRRCDERFERMFDSGAIEEVQALLAATSTRTCRSCAIGVRRSRLI